MNELALHRFFTWLEIAFAVVTFVAVRFITAPYGRHARPGWGPTLPARAGWILMESPAVILWLAIYAAGAQRAAPAPIALAALWQIHYVHRTFVFPFRMPAGANRMPILIALSGVTFNCLNAYVNARWVSGFGHYPTAWLTDPRFVVGALIFFAGLAINLHADTVLLRLRRRREGYQIPHGGLFERVSCPNYLGELIEWCGWAIATWSLPGLAFALYAIANLGPRARAHHLWYRAKFPHYPPARKALLPFVY